MTGKDRTAWIAVAVAALVALIAWRRPWWLRWWALLLWFIIAWGIVQAAVLAVFDLFAGVIR